MRAAESFCGIEQMTPRVKILVEEVNPRNLVEEGNPRYGFGQRKKNLDNDDERANSCPA